MTCIFVRRNAARVSLIAALGLFASLASVAPAQQRVDVCDDHPIVGCGKGRAMLLDLAGDQPYDGPQPREALADTDLLSNAIDIELSNINTSAGNCTITGSNVMTIRSKSPALSQFTFRLRDNYTVTGLTVTDGGNTVPVTHSLVPNRTRIVTLNRTYGMDEEFLLNIAYTGTSLSVGLNASSFNVGTHSGGLPVVASLSEPYYAYSWWPVKDGDVGVAGDNGDKSTTQVSVTVPNTLVVPSNGLLQGVDDLSGSRRRYRWATNYPISTYLVSIAAAAYNSWSLNYTFPAGPYNPAGNMPVEFYIYPGSDNASNRNAWGNCLNMLATYRGLYGEYPFVNEKYGIYQFNFGGGMEHQTITGQGTFSESVTAHELGHQWWGDMITCRTWSDIWLNEGFADYTECLWEERKAGGINTTAYYNALKSRRPTANGANDSVYVYDVSSATRIFSSDYSYYKGGWVLHMLRHYVGDATFFQILTEYREAYAYSAATTDNFAQVASAVAGQDLTTFFNQFVKQKGAPTYQYGWQSANVGGQDYLLVRVAQTQTATAGSPPQVQSVYVMPVDLKATIGGSPQVFKIRNDARTEWFVVPVPGPVTALAFDYNDLDATLTPTPRILRGAATSVAYVAGPPKIVAVSPAPGSSTEASPSLNQIAVTFHTGVNCTASDFTLTGANTGPKTFTLASGTNVNPAILILDAPLAADDYTLVVSSTVLAANSGQPLDGEIVDPQNPASLPSGDGINGGNAVLQFEVTPQQIIPTDGDIDANGSVNALDLQLLIDVLLGIDTDLDHVSRSDIDHNGFADGDDIQAFVNIYPGI